MKRSLRSPFNRALEVYLIHITREPPPPEV